jgi:tetratricopeptide (TPR) repeat protein
MRPWLSNKKVPTKSIIEDDSRRRCEPHELLDDIPPMSFDNGMTSARYPVEELYPTVDDSGNNTGETPLIDRTRKYYSPSPSYSIVHPVNDANVEQHAKAIGNDEEDSYDYSYSHYPSPFNHIADDEVEIVESRDSEISEYTPLNADYDDIRISSPEGGGNDDGARISTSPSSGGNNDNVRTLLSEYNILKDEYNIVKAKAEAALADVEYNNSRYMYDNDDDVINTNSGIMVTRQHGSERKTMNKSKTMVRSKTSVSSFDRLYDTETVESYASYNNSKEDGSNCYSLTTPMGIDEYVSIRDNNAKLTHVSEEGIIDEDQSDYAFDEINSDSIPAGTKSKNAYTPKRSNRLDYPSLTPSPAPPRINRRTELANEIFRDSSQGSKSDVYINENSESSVAVSPNDAPSVCSAIEELNSLQEITRRGETITNDNEYVKSRLLIKHDITLNPLRRREDPPEHDIGYYPPNDDAKEPEGIFPDIDLWRDKDGDMKVDKVPSTASFSRAKQVPTASTARAKHVTVNEQVNRNYEPSVGDCNGSDYAEDDVLMDDKDSIEESFEDDYVSKNMSHDDSSFQDDSSKENHDKGIEARGYKFTNGQIRKEYNRTAAADPDSDISVISEDTAIRNLVAREQKTKQLKNTRNQRQNESKRRQQRQKCESYYEVKRKDSMESEIKLDVDPAVEIEKKPKPSKNEPVQAYSNIKRNDSMENEMSIEFDEQVDERRHDRNVIDEQDAEDELPNDIELPPKVKQILLEDAYVGRYDDQYYDDTMGTKSFVSDSSYSSEDDESISEASEASKFSEASDDPIYFPTKAILQMNLGQQNANDDLNESDDLVEQACSHLSRGRNNDALSCLAEAFQLAQSNVNNAKIQLDDFYFHRKRGDTGPKHVPLDELESKLHTALRDTGSEMANVLNNIGVVQEMMGDYQLAMNSFRDALDVYRNLCHRYENTGDNDVDRTVNNIMQMGIAARHHEKRIELHTEADELATQVENWLHTQDSQIYCTQLQIKRLNVLMCVLELEAESLGQDHPAVGFTLLKKGDLHLEMKHVDMAIKDTRDAVSILKKGLGGIHPEVGLALVKLGDMFNYNVGRFGAGNDDRQENRFLALSFYQEALLPLRESFGKVNPHLGLAHNCLGILYSSKGELKQAMSSFYNALSSYGVKRRDDNTTTAENEKRSSSRPNVFFVWINVGGIHMMQAEWHLALRSYLKARSAFRCLNDEERKALQIIGPRLLMTHGLTLSKECSPFDDNDTLIASVLQNIGKAQSMLHQYGKAIETLEEALQIHQVVALRATGNMQGCLSSVTSRDFARMLQNLGEVEMISGDLTSAFNHYVESLKLLRSNELVDDSSIEVAIVLGAIGQIHLKKDEYSEAKIVLKESMRMFEKLGK